MQNIFTKTRIKIVLVLLFTFFSVKLITPNLFIANSPRINPLFITGIINAPKEIALLPGKFLSSLSNIRFNLFNNETNIKVDPEIIAKVKQVIPPPNAVFKYVSKGVSAAEDPQTGEKYIRIEAGTKYKIIGYITINGVKYPKIKFIE